ncbi:MAG: hypothetical protein R3E39_31770 [Anaerolineae bacterium]
MLLLLLVALFLWAYERFGRGSASEAPEAEIEPIIYERPVRAQPRRA